MADPYKEDISRWVILDPAEALDQGLVYYLNRMIAHLGLQWIVIGPGIPGPGGVTSAEMTFRLVASEPYRPIAVDDQEDVATGVQMMRSLQWLSRRLAPFVEYLDQEYVDAEKDEEIVKEEKRWVN